MEEQKRRRERKSAAYWLSKSSILYPICILYVMYVKQVINRLRYILQNVPSIFRRGQCFLPMRCA